MMLAIRVGELLWGGNAVRGNGESPVDGEPRDGLTAELSVALVPEMVAMRWNDPEFESKKERGAKEGGGGRRG